MAMLSPLDRYDPYTKMICDSASWSQIRKTLREEETWDPSYRGFYDTPSTESVTEFYISNKTKTPTKEKKVIARKVLVIAMDEDKRLNENGFQVILEGKKFWTKDSDADILRDPDVVAEISAALKAHNETRSQIVDKERTERSNTGKEYTLPPLKYNDLKVGVCTQIAWK